MALATGPASGPGRCRHRAHSVPAPLSAVISVSTPALPAGRPASTRSSIPSAPRSGAATPKGTGIERTPLTRPARCRNSRAGPSRCRRPRRKRRFRTDGFSARYRLSLHRAKSNRRRIDGGTVEVMAIGGRQDPHARLQLVPGPVGRLAGGLALASVTSSPPTPHVP